MPRRPARSRTRIKAFSTAFGRSKSLTSSSIRPASILERSRMSLMRDSRCWPEAWMSFRYSACLSLSSPNSRSFSTSEKPMTALSGVRSSWDMLARNSDLCRLAASSWALLSAISRNRRAFWMASADCVAKVRRRSTVAGGNSPGALRFTAKPPRRWPSRDDGHGDERANSGPEESLARPALVRPRHLDVRYLNGLEGDGRLPHHALPLADRRAAGHHSGGPGRCPLEELLRSLVVLEDRPAIEPRELHGPRHDGGEHRLQIERRADRLADLAERGELPDRARQLLRPRLQLLEQADVLDRDHRLVGKGLEQRDLVGRERARFPSRDRDQPEGHVLADHWDEQVAVPSACPTGLAHDVADVGSARDVFDRIGPTITHSSFARRKAT